MIETINGLLSVKPGNEPEQGETRTFVIEHRPARNGKKAWIKIKGAGENYGGAPYRILSVEPTGYTDAHGNISFNVEIEKTANGEQHGDEHGIEEIEESGGGSTFRKVAGIHNSGSAGTNGINEARQHLCQAANLYNLCVKAVDAMIVPTLPEVARTSEQFQAAVGTLFIEASRAGFVSKMLPKPVPNSNDKIERNAGNNQEENLMPYEETF